MTVKIAAAQYNISFLENWAAYQQKIEGWVAEATTQDAKILLFPEYFSMELASLFGTGDLFIIKQTTGGHAIIA